MARAGKQTTRIADTEEDLVSIAGACRFILHLSKLVTTLHGNLKSQICHPEERGSYTGNKSFGWPIQAVLWLEWATMPPRPFVIPTRISCTWLHPRLRVRLSVRKVA
jgi:hypothetical protein